MKIFLKEVMISLVFSILLILVLSILISKTSMEEKFIVPGIITISSISIFLR